MSSASLAHTDALFAQNRVRKAKASLARNEAWFAEGNFPAEHRELFQTVIDGCRKELSEARDAFRHYAT